MSDLARAVAFEESLREHAADRVEPLPYGRAVFTPSLPLVWDLNNVRVDRDTGLSARDLAAEADRLLGGAGLAHRRIALLDDALAESLEDGFRDLGWRSDRFVYMVRRRETQRTSASSLVIEVTFDALAAIRAEIVRAEPWGKSDAVVEQLRRSSRRVADAGRARHFAVLVDGEPAAAADLYSDGRTAQVEDVATREPYRGRGYATAVVLRAVEEADRTGHDFVFLIADDNDWPKHLYARLGFDEVGRKSAFLKAPPPAGAGAGAAAS